MTHFLDRKIYLITGKGGVGRTTVTVALGRAIAKHNRRVLLCEIGDPEGGYSQLGRHFGRETLSPEPVLLAPNLFGCHLWGSTGHEMFLRQILPAGPLIRAALRSKALSRFLLAAPSFHEMGIFYHLLTLIESKNADKTPSYDHILIDMPATGHTLALTGLPEILLRLIPSGPIAKAMKRGQSYLNDPAKGAALVVTLPEQLPISETIELLQGLKNTDMHTGGIILNRMPISPFTAEENAALEAYISKQPLCGELAWRAMTSAAQAAERLKQFSQIPLVILPDRPERGSELETALLPSFEPLFTPGSASGTTH